jgi:hypothetical protein
MPLQLIDKYEVIERPEYTAVLDDFRDDATGEQMVLMHIEFFMTLFTPSAMKRLIEDWSAFRSVTDAPLYGLEPEPDDSKWERFVSHLGFKNTHSRVDCTDGQSRRLFVSLPLSKDNDEHEQHYKVGEHD